MFFSQYFLKILLLQLLTSFWLPSAGPPSLLLEMKERALVEQTTEKAAAEQIGGDKLALASPSADVLKSLPLALSRLEKEPRRQEGAADFNWKSLTAQAAYVMDSETNLSLFAEQENDIRAIGSLTKLMTALVFLETSPDWDKVVTIEENDSGQGRLYLAEGEIATVRVLFNVALVSSSNNATLALARSTSLSLEEFTTRMNAKARVMGLVSTHFIEPTGLDPANQSTAREVVLILKAALSEKMIRETVSQKKYDFQLENGRSRVADSTDLLLSENFPQGKMKSVIGGKTGYVEEAGYCFAFAAENEEGHQIITVVLGSETHFSRFSEAKALTRWAFEAYEWP